MGFRVAGGKSFWGVCGGGRRLLGGESFRRRRRCRRLLRLTTRFLVVLGEVLGRRRVGIVGSWGEVVGIVVAEV